MSESGMLQCGAVTPHSPLTTDRVEWRLWGNVCGMCADGGSQWTTLWTMPVCLLIPDTKRVYVQEWL